MGRLPKGYASTVLINGAAGDMPGMGGETMDEVPFLLAAKSLVDLTTTTAVDLGMAPFPARIVSGNLLYPTAPDADTVISFGTAGSSSKYEDHTAVSADLSDGDLESGIAMGTTDLVDAGDQIQVVGDGAPAAGTALPTLIVVPRIP